MDTSMGILGVLLLVVGLIAIQADNQRRTILAKNERLADALDDEHERNYQLKRRLEQVKRDPLWRGVGQPEGGWTPSRRRRIEAIFTRDWPKEPERE